MRVSGWFYLIQQGLCALSLLFSMGQCARLRRRSLPRMIAVSLVAGLICLTAALFPLSLLRIAALIVTALLSPQAAWPGLPRSIRVRLAVSSAALSLILAGWARFLSGLHLAGTLLFFAVVVSMPLLARLLSSRTEARCATVEILHGGHRLCLTALVDSGNLLRDPLTGLPVIVVSRKAAAQLISLPPPGEINPGMRLISVRTIAGTSLMAIFRPGRIRLLLPGGWQTVRAMIGLSPAGYSGFQALVPAGLTVPDSSQEILSQGGKSSCP